jgi:hypothetical protein
MRNISGNSNETRDEREGTKRSERSNKKITMTPVMVKRKKKSRLYRHASEERINAKKMNTNSTIIADDPLSDHVQILQPLRASSDMTEKE